AKKVSAAPHRGNANRPLRNQGKATAAGKQTNRQTDKQQIRSQKRQTNCTANLTPTETKQK
ncbi:hypothetical protein P0D75_40455, partial [Paraburkholderia sediminicola]|uniref:hypothetical protein n=1 Tax=Paraburkholderia sediminicola TaxID=458836 RepID=UPI0038B86237